MMSIAPPTSLGGSGMLTPQTPMPSSQRVPGAAPSPMTALSRTTPGTSMTALSPATPGTPANTPASASMDRAALGRDFEAAMLTPLMKAMLPPEDSAVWGRDGTMWRGVFASELAAAVARSGGVGLSDAVEDALAQPGEGQQ